MGVRPLKAVLAGLLVLALGAMWTNRGWVLDAYRSDGPVASVRLGGVDLAFQPTPIEPTPYRLPSAPDTRSVARSVAFAPEVARPVPPPSLGGGEAVLRGTVTGPDGPVPGAVVRIERHTDHGAVSVDTVTGEDGAWAMGPLAGGRYRIRAWFPNLLTMGRSEVRFVADDEVASFDFDLWGIDPSPTFELVDGGPMYEGAAATVAVFLGWRSIDADGLVVTNPLPGAEVTAATTAQVEVLSAQPLVTGADGVAPVVLRCVPTSVAPLDDPLDPAASTVGQVGPEGVQAPTVPGPGGTLTATSGTTSATFALPGCRPVPPADPDPGSGPAPQPGGGTDDGTLEPTDDPSDDPSDDEADSGA